MSTNSSSLVIVVPWQARLVMGKEATSGVFRHSFGMDVNQHTKNATRHMQRLFQVSTMIPNMQWMVLAIESHVEGESDLLDLWTGS